MAGPLRSRRPVHPRRRGEHIDVLYPEFGRRGSSPQARGTQLFGAERLLHRRFIPAGAGNTPHRSEVAPRIAVHPRRRGEHAPVAVSMTSYNGSSPQARGTQSLTTRIACVKRFIPAGAGNTFYVLHFFCHCSVHPRRRGEHTRWPRSAAPIGGSSPQARGTRRISQA